MFNIQCSMFKTCLYLFEEVSWKKLSANENKRYMNGQPDKEKAAGTVYNASLPFLKVDECERVKGQLADIAQDMKEGLRQNQRCRFHM